MFTQREEGGGLIGTWKGKSTNSAETPRSREVHKSHGGPRGGRGKARRGILSRCPIYIVYVLGRVSPARGRWEEGYTGRSPRQRSTTLQFSLHKQSGKRNEEKEGRAKDILYVVYTDTHRWRAANRGGNEKKKLNFSQVRNIVDFSPPVEIGGFSLRGKPLGADYYVVLHGRCRTALLPQRRNKGPSHIQVVVLPMNDSVAGCAGDFKEMKIGG